MEHTHFTHVCEYGAVLSKMCVSFMVMVFPTVCGEINAGSDTISPAQNTMNRNVKIALVGNKIDLAPTKTADKHYHSSGRSVCHSLHSYSYTACHSMCRNKHSIAIMVFCVK